MEAPKEIYISNDHHGWYPENDGGDKIKYIRADLAELTWEDIEKIVDLYEDVYSDYSCNGNAGITNTAEHYQEVLRRFNEAKQDEGK